MNIKSLVAHAFHSAEIRFRFFEACFASFGAMWMIVEICSFFSKSEEPPCGLRAFAVVAFAFAVFFFLYDGFFRSGFLKFSETIQNAALGTSTIEIRFGDIFDQKGWLVIGVNEYFDSVVDEQIVAKKSLHGQMITRFFTGCVNEWEDQVSKELKSSEAVNEERKNKKAKPLRYAIGTAAKVEKNDKRFVCVALSHTDISTDKASADPNDLSLAVKGALGKARECCSGEPVAIPLMGAGLAGVDMNENLLLIHIVRSVFEECKSKKVTDRISIVIHPSLLDRVDLSIVEKLWRN